MLMREILVGPLRAAALSAFIAGLLLLLLNPPSFAGVGGLLTLFAGALAVVLMAAWAVVALSGREMPEPEFRRLVDRSEALAALPPPDRPPSEFDELVIRALDDLPEEFQEVLARTPVTVSNRGREHGAYGLYMGATVARDTYPDRIVIFQDTLAWMDTIRKNPQGPNPTLYGVERFDRYMSLMVECGWARAAALEPQS